jgi:hypothetical protein
MDLCSSGLLTGSPSVDVLSAIDGLSIETLFQVKEKVDTILSLYCYQRTQRTCLEVLCFFSCCLPSFHSLPHSHPSSPYPLIPFVAAVSFNDHKESTTTFGNIYFLRLHQTTNIASWSG